MFIVIYSFKTKKGQEPIFETAWRELTLLFRNYAGSLGSRLHKKADQHYIAYAQWPDKKTLENANSKLPDEATAVGKTMRNACEKIEILHELNVVDDLLIKNLE